VTRDQLHALLALQKIDLTLLQLKKESQTIPARQEAIRSRVDAAKAAEQAAKEAIQACEAEIREDELEVEAVRSQVAKYKTQQMEAKSNEQYKAFNHEIAAAEDKIGQAEDRELEHMSRLEELKDAKAETIREREAAEAQAEAEVGSLDERLEVIKTTFAELKEERTALIGRIPTDVVEQYMGQLGKKQDAEVVAVRQENCGGCHMKLTPQILHDVHSLQKWTSCGFCGRYLYDPAAV
jgi:predicted  nucleic acid-binding Zn-ribbon protein